MTLVCSGGCELTELVTYHVLGNIYRNVLSAVMYGKCMTYEIREYGGRSAPCLEYLLLACLIHGKYSLVESLLNVRSLLDTSAHRFYSFISDTLMRSVSAWTGIILAAAWPRFISYELLAVATPYDELIGTVVILSGLVAECGLAPRGNRSGTADR